MTVAKNNVSTFPANDFNIGELVRYENCSGVNL